VIASRFPNLKIDFAANTTDPFNRANGSEGAIQRDAPAVKIVVLDMRRRRRDVARELNCGFLGLDARKASNVGATGQQLPE
jgi:hypothetical protein